MAPERSVRKGQQENNKTHPNHHQLWYKKVTIERLFFSAFPVTLTVVSKLQLERLVKSQNYQSCWSQKQRLTTALMTH